MTTERPYIARIKSTLQSRPYLGQLCDILKQEEKSITRFSLVDLNPNKAPRIQQTTNVRQAKSIVQQKATTPRFRIYVVENISPAFIELVGSTWDLDVEFFVDHALGCRGDLSRVPVNLASIRERAPFFCIDGVSSYTSANLEEAYGDAANPIPRFLFRDRKHYFRRDFRMRTDGKGFQLDTRASYYAKKISDNDWVGQSPLIILPLTRSLAQSM
jgi:hypothetical protein